jgi:hypothetical protein
MRMAGPNVTCPSAAIARLGAIVGCCGLLAGPESPQSVGIVPVHAALKALLGERRAESTAAVRAGGAWCSRLRPTVVLDPHLGPSQGATSRLDQLAHGKQLLPFAHELANTPIILRCQLRELRDVQSTVITHRPLVGQVGQVGHGSLRGAHDGSGQRLCRSAASRARGTSSRRCVVARLVGCCGKLGILPVR